MDCNVCCETVTKRNIVVCLACDFESCKKCIKTYLLDTSQDPHCMSCKHVWTRDFLINSTSKSWVDKDLKKHRENTLFEREKSMMPATQGAVEEYLEKKKVYEELQKLGEQRRKLESQVMEIRNKMYDLRNPEQQQKERKQFIRKCPGENCKGFLSTAWKCGICESNVCKDCNEIYLDKDTHVCNEEAKKTVEFLAKDTKPCPSCGTMIHKIEGCDQMFCIECKAGFSWIRGTIEKGVIHNPHYYALLRNNPGMEVRRNPGDFDCGGLPNLYLYMSKIKKLSQKNVCKKHIDLLLEIHRQVHHIQEVEIPNYYVPDNIHQNESERISYMLNEIDEQNFKRKIQMKEKKNQKKSEIHEVLQMVHSTTSDIIRNLLDSLDNIKNDDFKEKFNELRKIQSYANDALENISQTYSNCVVPYITLTNHL